MPCAGRSVSCAPRAVMESSEAMKDKVCLVTGASSGIGRATAVGLARMAARVVLVSRSRERGEEALAAIRAQSGNDNLGLLVADLSRQASVRQLAQSFQERFSHLHVLVNNAGVYSSRHQLTEDGIEITLAVNYLAPFLLTHLLLDRLRAATAPSAHARIINVSSQSHYLARIKLDRLNTRKGLRAYSQSKLALLLWTRELSQRLQGSGVTVNCLCPGWVSTSIGEKHSNRISAAVWWMCRFFLMSPERAARAVLYLASSPEVEPITGQFFMKQRQASPGRFAEDVALRQQLWTVSEELTGIRQPV